MDFTEFFPSITEADLRAYVEGRPMLFSGWTTYDINVVCMIVFRHSRLTIGAPTSPAVSNVICLDMDTAISNLCAKRGVTYTRYADDLFFSTIEPGILHPLQHDIEKLVPELALPAHLRINDAKTRHSSRRGLRRITGIVIGSDRKPHVGRDLKRKIRAMVHKVESLDLSARARLSGLLGYAVGFDQKFMNKLIIKYGNDLVEKAIHPALK
jgi:RNA-directed DNA polymerase